MILLLSSAAYIYVKKVKKLAIGLEIEFFAMEKHDSIPEIPSDSYFVKTFCKNMVKTLDISDPTLVGQNLKFKQDYLQTMYDESSTLRVFYEPMMQARKKEIMYWKSCKKSIIQKITEVAPCYLVHWLFDSLHFHAD